MKGPTGQLVVSAIGGIRDSWVDGGVPMEGKMSSLVVSTGTTNQFHNVCNHKEEGEGEGEVSNTQTKRNEKQKRKYQFHHKRAS